MLIDQYHQSHYSSIVTATYEWAKSEANFYLIDIPHNQLSQNELVILTNSDKPLKLQGVHYENTKFSHKSLKESNFKFSSLINCSFEGADCTGCCFDNCI